MRLAALALTLLVLVPPARAEVVTVGTGDLRAQIETDPWSLAFIDANGREIFGESRAMPIGYRTATGWVGATRATSVVRDGAAVVAEVETTGRPIRVRIEPGAPGTVAIEATPLGGEGTALGIGFDATSTEHFYGLGERPERVDHRGTWRGTFFRREKLRSVTRRRRWDLVVRGRRNRRYSLQAALPFEPCSVTVGDHPVRFRYNPRTQALRVTFAARRTTVTVKAC